jgi:hypothetical protein
MVAVEGVRWKDGSGYIVLVEQTSLVTDWMREREET